MQTCGISAEFEQNLLKISKIDRTNLSFIVSLSEVFLKGTKKKLRSQISLLQIAKYVKTTSK